ncbi:hypothetical protein EV363DRAFT_1341100 [Boletus edulis]|nr:hypothetical protein EV363DRAFT_1341100 [Boletus edulis]
MAKSVAYVGNGDKDKGYRTCDIAFEHFHNLVTSRPLIALRLSSHVHVVLPRATNMAINTPKRHTCIIYLDAHTCSAVTTTHARPVSVFILSIVFALVASDVVQGAFRQEIQLQFEGDFWQCCTVQRMHRVHDTLRALMMPTDTIRETFDLR